MCEHECNVDEKYVLPQARTFGLSWSMATDQSYFLQCTEKHPLGATGWPSNPDPTHKQTVDKGQVVAQAQAQGLVSASSMHTWPRAR